MFGVDKHQQIVRLVSRLYHDGDAPLKKIHCFFLAVLSSGAQFVGDHVTLASRRQLGTPEDP